MGKTGSGGEFRLFIATGGAAFDHDTTAELSRLLREVAARVERGENEDEKILDVNGNVVGEFSLRFN